MHGCRRQRGGASRRSSGLPGWMSSRLVAVLIWLLMVVGATGARLAGPTECTTVKYADPHKVSFQGARLAGGLDNRGGCSADEPPQREPWALEVLTANTTGWGPLQRLLASTDAQVVLAQEHELRGQEIAEASDWAIRRGWKSLWVEASVTEAGGRSGGVAILARDYLGLSPPPWGDPQIVPARAIAAKLEAPGCRPTVVMSTYLIDGIGPAAANRHILARIGDRLQSLGHDGGDANCRHAGPMPYLVGGDFNMTPAVLAGTGITQRINASLVAPRAARGTCRTAKSARTLDYFLVSGGMEQGIRAVTVGDNSIIKTHAPVTLAFRPRLTTLRALALRVPPKLPVDRVHGHIRPLPMWNDVRRNTRRAVQLAKSGTTEAAQEALNGAYQAWAHRAEEELQEVTGTRLPKAACRGQGPRLAWRTIIPEKLRRGDRSRAADISRRAVAQLRDAQIAAAAAKEGKLDQAWRMTDELDHERRQRCSLHDGLAPPAREYDDGANDDGCYIIDDIIYSLAANTSSMYDGVVIDWQPWDDAMTHANDYMAARLKRDEAQERSEARIAWRDLGVGRHCGRSQHAHRVAKLTTA